jgi:UDP-2-acetamido-3-amino-2,3-dideoxy-glucuronate N-acetyltransferase
MPLLKKKHFSEADWLVKTRIEKGASVGANATIVAGVTLGEYCLVGAGSVVTKDVPAFALVVGNPARIIGRVNERGERID